MADEGEEQVKDGPKEQNQSTNAGRAVRGLRKKKNIIRKIMTLVSYLLNLRYLQVTQ